MVRMLLKSEGTVFTGKPETLFKKACEGKPILGPLKLNQQSVATKKANCGYEMHCTCDQEEQTSRRQRREFLQKDHNERLSKKCLLSV